MLVNNGCLSAINTDEGLNVNASKLLDQLLKSGQEFIQNKTGQSSQATTANKTGSLLSSLGGGALGGGALGLLLSNKKARDIGGKLAIYGGIAALGVLAYRAYGDWQQKKDGTTAASPNTLDRLPSPQAEQHSRAILAAMIAAAKADGHVSPDEQQLLETELLRLSDDPQDRQWLEQELAHPLDPSRIASLAQTPEIAVEMYLASVVVVDEEGFMERAYLDELAKQLKLEPGLKQHLEQQAKAVA
ncbi:tellurite resistance TerB family protein [Neisseriaceae bacterium TC5R-5]|nr:tellurite resistance TerB family protein [Neisseriaceae bacterium TC5R-5]